MGSKDLACVPVKPESRGLKKLPWSCLLDRGDYLTATSLLMEEDGIITFSMAT